jgi:HNH endonuclease
MAPKTLPPRELLCQLLHYDPDAGDFTWLPRPREMFSSKHNCGTWHTRYAGKRAGCIEPGGYRVIHLGDRTCKEHRLVWLYVHGEPVPIQIDHIDRDRTNNRIANLRAATPSQNIANSKGYGRLGVKGVRPWKGSFRAHIRFNGTGFHLGTFATVEEAAQAYREAAIRLQGEFARWD